MRDRRAKLTRWSCRPVVHISNHCWRYVLDLQSHSAVPINSHSLSLSFVAGKSLQTPDHHPERRVLQPSAGDPRVYVRGRGERVAGAAPNVPQDRRPTESEGAGGNADKYQAGRLIFHTFTRMGGGGGGGICCVAVLARGMGDNKPPPPSHAPCAVFFFSSFLLSKRTLIYIHKYTHTHILYIYKSHLHGNHET